LSAKSSNDRVSDLLDWALSVALALWILFVFRTDIGSFVHAHEFSCTGAAILIVVAAVVLSCLIRPCLDSYCDMFHANFRRFWGWKTPRARKSPPLRGRR
jgi:membrane protein YdbS with pleckstrin-like domain